MQIVHVITRLVLGGAAKVLSAVVRDQIKRGHRVTVISGSPDGSGTWLIDTLRESGVSLLLVPSLVRPVAPQKDLLALVVLTRLFRSGRFDVAHLHTSKAGVIGSMAARAAGIRAVIFAPHGHIFQPQNHIPGVPEGGVRREIFRALMRIAYRLSDRIVALSRTDAREQVSLALAPAGKFTVIENGIDTEHFASVPAESVEAARNRMGPPGHKIVLFVGRFAPEKGLGHLLRAFAAVRAVVPSTLAVLGEGPWENYYRKLAGKLGLQDSVRFLGCTQNVAPYYHAADVLAIPSFYESFGLVLLEGMASGVPVLASNVGTLPEVLCGGRYGELARPGEKEEWAAKLIHMLQAPEQVRLRAESAARYARRRYSERAMAERVACLYEEVLGRAGSSPRRSVVREALFR